MSQFENTLESTYIESIRPFEIGFNNEIVEQLIFLEKPLEYVRNNIGYFLSKLSGFLNKNSILRNYGQGSILFRGKNKAQSKLITKSIEEIVNRSIKTTIGHPVTIYNFVNVSLFTFDGKIFYHVIMEDGNIILLDEKGFDQYSQENNIQIMSGKELIFKEIKILVTKILIYRDSDKKELFDEFYKCQLELKNCIIFDNEMQVGFLEYIEILYKKTSDNITYDEKELLQLLLTFLSFVGLFDDSNKYTKMKCDCLDRSIEQDLGIVEFDKYGNPVSEGIFGSNLGNKKKLSGESNDEIDNTNEILDTTKSPNKAIIHLPVYASFEKSNNELLNELMMILGIRGNMKLLDMIELLSQTNNIIPNTNLENLSTQELVYVFIDVLFGVDYLEPVLLSEHDELFDFKYEGQRIYFLRNEKENNMVLYTQKGLNTKYGYDVEFFIEARQETCIDIVKNNINFLQKQIADIIDKHGLISGPDLDIIISKKSYKRFFKNIKPFYVQKYFVDTFINIIFQLGTECAVSKNGIKVWYYIFENKKYCCIFDGDNYEFCTQDYLSKLGIEIKLKEISKGPEIFQDKEQLYFIIGECYDELVSIVLDTIYEYGTVSLYDFDFEELFGFELTPEQVSFFSNLLIGEIIKNTSNQFVNLFDKTKMYCFSDGNRSGFFIQDGLTIQIMNIHDFSEYANNNQLYIEYDPSIVIKSLINRIYILLNRGITESSIIKTIVNIGDLYFLNTVLKYEIQIPNLLLFYDYLYINLGDKFDYIKKVFLERILQALEDNYPYYN